MVVLAIFLLKGKHSIEPCIRLKRVAMIACTVDNISAVIGCKVFFEIIKPCVYGGTLRVSDSRKSTGAIGGEIIH